MRESSLILILIFFLIGCERDKKKDARSLNVTFDDVRVVFSKHCISCHNAKGIAPIKLYNYDRIVKNKDLIKSAICNKLMPPYSADPKYSHFIEENVLSNHEKAIIISWVNEGCKKGQYSDVNLDSDSQGDTTINKADYSIVLSGSLRLDSARDERFVIYKVNLNNDKPLLVNKFEFHPSNSKITHHAWLFIDSLISQTSSSTNYFVSLLSSESNEFHMPFPYYQEQLLYVPGVNSISLSQNTCYYIPKYAILYVQIHLLNKIHSPNLSFRLNIFKSNNIEPQVVSIKNLEEDLLTEQLLIPPDSIKTITLKSKPLKKATVIYRLTPHMHLRGKSIWAFATDGRDTIPLIKIDKWDFMWQYNYTFKKAILIPAGWVIYVAGTYDNTIYNPTNPVLPPQFVSYGIKSTDEMLRMNYDYTQ